MRGAKYFMEASCQTPTDAEVEMAVISGWLGWTALRDGESLEVVAFDPAEDVIVGIRVALNPDKPQYLTAAH